MFLVIMFLGCLFLGFITKIVFALSVGVFILTAYIIGIIFMAFVIYNKFFTYIMKWRNFIQDLVLIIIGVILSIIPEKSEFTEMLTTFFITGGVVKLVWDFIVNSDED